MLKNSPALIFLFFLATTSFAQSPDWSSEIADIIYSNCSSCHHEGGIAPFALMSYDDAVNNVYGMQSAINSRKMPPWPPDPDYSHFTGERILADADIAAINEWINGGMPAGNLATAPEPPVYNGNSLMTNIEETVQLPEYTVQMSTDEYRTFVIHTNYTEAKYLNEIEFIPGDPSAVHHILMYHDSSDISYEKDMDDPAPGFASNGTTTASPYAVMISGWAPGGGVSKLPQDMGFKVPPGSDYVVEIHYAPGSIGKTDASKINLKFTTVPNVRQVYVFPLLYHFPPSLMNWPLVIPANQVKTFNEKSGTFPDDYSLLGLGPHMHFIGKSFKVFMVNSPGDTTNLIYIPDWNFHWQMAYNFQNLIKFPSGAQIYGQAVYDNTSNNPNNPNNPPQIVTVGESTLNEMMVCFFAFLDYKPGDENIIIDSTLISSVPETNASDFQVNVYPNPANEFLYLSMNLPAHNLNLRLLNELGKSVQEISEYGIANGAYSRKLDISNLPAGFYTLEIISGEKHVTRKIVLTD